MVLYLTPVAVLTAVTVALATTAPEGSVTEPLILALAVAAYAGLEEIEIAAAKRSVPATLRRESKDMEDLQTQDEFLCFADH
jgi:hypothetical protein